MYYIIYLRNWIPNIYIYIYFFISSAWFQGKPVDFINSKWTSKNLKTFGIQNLRDSSMMRISTLDFLSLLRSISITIIKNTDKQQEQIYLVTGLDESENTEKF